jgi:hypothetical protein
MKQEQLEELARKTAEKIWNNTVGSTPSNHAAIILSALQQVNDSRDNEPEEDIDAATGCSDDQLFKDVPASVIKKAADELARPTGVGERIAKRIEKYVSPAFREDVIAIINSELATVQQKSPAEAWKFISGMCAESEKAEHMTNAVLAETLQRKIADHIPMNDPAFALIAEAADRLATAQLVAASVEEIATQEARRACPRWTHPEHNAHYEDVRRAITRATAALSAQLERTQQYHKQAILERDTAESRIRELEQQLNNETEARLAIEAHRKWLHEQIAQLEQERDAWQRRAEGMKLGNENYARQVAQLKQDKARLRAVLTSIGNWEIDNRNCSHRDAVSLLSGMANSGLGRTRADAAKAGQG